MRISVSGRSGARCPYCRDELTRAEGTACERCGVRLHAECAAELQVCPVHGCGGRMAGRRRRSSSPGWRLPPVSEWPSWAYLGALAAVFVTCSSVNDNRARRAQRRRDESARRYTERALERLRVQEEERRARQFEAEPAGGAEAQASDHQSLSAAPGPVGRLQLSSWREDITLPLGSLLQSEDGLRLVVGREVVLGAGQTAEVEVVVLDPQRWRAWPPQVARPVVREAQSGEESRASYLVRRAMLSPAPPAWLDLQVAVVIDAFDPRPADLFGSARSEVREAALDGAYELLRRVLGATPTRYRALGSFLPLRAPQSYLPVDLAALPAYRSFLPLRASPDRESSEQVFHLYAEAPLSPAQQLSLWERHGYLQLGLEHDLGGQLARLESAGTLPARLLTIAHLQRLRPLLGAGLLAAHAEEGLLGRPGPTQAQAVARWRRSAGDVGLRIGSPSGPTLAALVEREAEWRARWIQDLAQRAFAGGGPAREALVELAAHEPRHPELARLIAAALREGGEVGASAARAAVWRLRAGQPAPEGLLASTPGYALRRAIREAVHVLPGSQRGPFWQACVEARAERAEVLRALVDLAEREELTPEDLGAWCTLAPELDSAEEALERWVHAEDLEAALIHGGASGAEAFGWAAIARRLVTRDGAPPAVAARLLGQAPSLAHRLEVVRALAARDASAAWSLVRSRRLEESADWQLEVLRLARLEASPLELRELVFRAATSRFASVRAAALPDLRHLAGEPQSLERLASSDDPQVARAACRFLVRDHPPRGQEILERWVDDGESWRAPAALELAHEVRGRMPRLWARIRGLGLRSPAAHVRERATALSN